MGNQPVKKIRYGGVSVVVFENQAKNKDGETFTSTSPTLSKSYQDKNQKWVNVNFGFRNSTEVINAIQCLQEYLTWKYKKEDAAAKQTDTKQTDGTEVPF